ncbi:MAG: hypothetical protein ABW076_13015 [Candidatus Thiodiazotropha sp.]
MLSKKILVTFLMVVVLSACATDPAVQAKRDEAAVAQRAAERWALLIEGRLESAYEYLTPGYRASTPYPHYQKSVKGQGLWQAATVENVQCEQESCDVKVKLNLKIQYPRMRKPIHTDTEVFERWIRGPDGVWGFLPKQ